MIKKLSLILFLAIFSHLCYSETKTVVSYGESEYCYKKDTALRLAQIERDNNSYDKCRQLGDKWRFTRKYSFEGYKKCEPCSNNQYRCKITDASAICESFENTNKEQPSKNETLNKDLLETLKTGKIKTHNFNIGRHETKTDRNKTEQAINKNETNQNKISNKTQSSLNKQDDFWQGNTVNTADYFKPDKTNIKKSQDNKFWSGETQSSTNKNNTNEKKQSRNDFWFGNKTSLDSSTIWQGNKKILAQERIEYRHLLINQCNQSIYTSWDSANNRCYELKLDVNDNSKFGIEYGAGGAGVHIFDYQQKPKNRSTLYISWNMYSIPDRIIIYFIDGKIKNKIYDSGMVSGNDSMYLPEFFGNNVQIVVTGSQNATKWNFTLSD